MSEFEKLALEKFKEMGFDGTTLQEAGSSLVDDNLDDEDDIGDEGDLSESEATEYQLGFPEEGQNLLHTDPDWVNWDGGKIGGKPIWLDPENLPNPDLLQCKDCEEPMKFLLQIYCPVDDVPNAFHRTLYLFCCRHATCVSNANIICIRSQLNIINPYYVKEPENIRNNKRNGITVDENEHEHENNEKSASSTLPPLCAVCGCHAPHKCSKCKITSYCSKFHQKMHWKEHKGVCTSASSTESVESIDGSLEGKLPKLDEIKDTKMETKRTKWCHKEYDLVVSPEYLANDSAEAIESSTTVWEDAYTSGDKEDEKEDLQLKQTDYDKALGNESRDPHYLKFLARMRRGGPDQVLRYCRWDDEHGPLSILTEGNQKNYQSPACVHCGGVTKFECQVMPQLLYYINTEQETKVSNPSVDEARRQVAMQVPPPANLSGIFRNDGDEDIDWGTIDIYTCTQSCSVNEEYGGGYLSEFCRPVFLPVEKATTKKA